MAPLDQAHISELHALAAERGVEGYRLLRRDELIAAIEAAPEGGEPPRRRRGLRRRRRAEPEAAVAEERKSRPRKPRERERLPSEPEAEPEGEEDGETETVTGVLEVTPQRYGFIRLTGEDAGGDDVYISASQVRRCELRSGDTVSGPARAPRRGERHRALVHVDTVNGRAVQLEGPKFDDLTAVAPRRRIVLDADRDDVLLRAVDLLTPLALGQRVLVRAAPRSGRTTLLRGIANAITASSEAQPILLLVDERPEEATAWREALPDADLAIAPADMAPGEQVRVAEQALERARRLAAGGEDAVLMVDSLSRLAVAADDVSLVKRLFGSGRELADDGAGSLTVIATIVHGGEDGDAVERAVATTESALIALAPKLAAAGVVPALAAGECSVADEDRLREGPELDAARRLRSLLADLSDADAVELLRERIEGSVSNAELLGSL